MTVRILHVSDLHLKDKEASDQEILVRAMIKDVISLHAERPVDIIVFTGDLSFSARADELDWAGDMLLDPLRSALDLPRSRIVLVPGNHDVDRREVLEFEEAGLRSNLVDTGSVNKILDDPTSLEAATKRMHSWHDFHSRFYGSEGPDETSPLAWAHRWSVGNQTVGVVALDSAWRAMGGGDDRHRLLLGDRQVFRGLAAIEECDVRLVAMHHPLEWLSDFDGDDARIQFERRGVIVLSGHTHTADPTGIVSGRGQAIYARAGCLYSGRGYLNSFSVLDIDRSAGLVVAWIRTWWPKRLEFGPGEDLAKDGKVELPFPASTGDEAEAPAYSTALGPLVNIVRERRLVLGEANEVIQTVDDVIVEPRFLALPFDQAVAAARVAASTEPNARTLPRADPLRSLDSDQAVLVCGDPQSGVSDAVIWLVATRFATDSSRRPIYLRYDDTAGKDPTEKALRRVLASEGVPLPPNQALPAQLVGLDDVSATKPKRLARLATHIAEHPESKYILGCHGEDHIALGESLKQSGVRFSKAFVGPFGRRELRDLVQKVTGGPPEGIVDKILGLLRSHRLPRTPVVMTALVYIVTRQQDVAALNQSTVLEAYVNSLLGRDDLADELGMDFRRREHLLSAIAGRLVRSDIDRLPRLETEEFVVDYFLLRGSDRSLSAGKVIDSFIARGVLADDRDGVGFRHPAMRDLFAAKWMTEDAEFDRLLRSDPIRYSSVLRHAAALLRNDAALLDVAAAAAAKIYEEVAPDLTLEMFDRIDDSRGWSRAPDIEQLKATMVGAAYGSSEEHLDRLYDEIELSDSEERDQLSEPVGVMGQAIALLANVLATSELVADPEQKKKLLVQALDESALFLVALAIREDTASILADSLQELEIAGLQGDETKHALTRFVGLILVMMVASATARTLAGPSLEVPIRELIKDERYMGSAARALLATLVYCELQLPGWPDVLSQLHERHHGHPYVSEIARVWAAVRYLSPATSDSQASRLEAFLAGLTTKSVEGGKVAVAARGQVKAQAIQELRSLRLRYRYSGEPDPAGEHEPEDAPEPDEV